MINSVTKSTTNLLNTSLLNAWIDLIFTTWFVSICFKHKLNQVKHWSPACAEIYHSLGDEDKLMFDSMSIEAWCILFFLFYVNSLVTQKSFTIWLQQWSNHYFILISAKLLKLPSQL